MTDLAANFTARLGELIERRVDAAHPFAREERKEFLANRAEAILDLVDAAERISAYYADEPSADLFDLDRALEALNRD